MFNGKKMLLMFSLLFSTVVLASEYAVAMGSKKVAIKNENENRKNNANEFELISNEENIFNHRWTNMFDSKMMESTPRMNIHETSDKYLVEAELPGVKKEDVNIVIKDNYLVINGEKKSINEENKNQYRRIERTQGQFFRSLLIPSDIDKDKITAELSDGVLTLEMIKSKNSVRNEKKIIIK
jgi:HSP20 family protein